MDLNSKPLLKSTRSLDEGFESDTDRISPDFHQHQPSSTFNFLQRSHRDGVHYMQISRRIVNGTDQSLADDIEYKIKKNNKFIEPKLSTIQSHLYESDRRKGGTMRPNATRSNSFDSIRHRDLIIQPNIKSDEMPGNFVKVSIAPKQIQNHKFKHTMHHQQQQLQQQQIKPIISHEKSVHTFYPAEGSLSLHSSPHNGLTYKSSHLNIQALAPISWTQSIPRQTRR